MAATGKRATIHDVARLAGVSIKTVSRVYNDEPNVREAIREKVNRPVRNCAIAPMWRHAIWSSAART